MVPDPPSLSLHHRLPLLQHHALQLPLQSPPHPLRRQRSRLRRKAKPFTVSTTLLERIGKNPQIWTIFTSLLVFNTLSKLHFFRTTKYLRSDIRAVNCLNSIGKKHTSPSYFALSENLSNLRNTIVYSQAKKLNLNKILVPLKFGSFHLLVRDILKLFWG